MKSLWFIGVASVALAAIATVSESGIAVGIAGGLTLGIGSWLLRRSLRKNSPEAETDARSGDPAWRRGWHSLEDRPAVERWSDGRRWTEFERLRIGPRRLIEQRTGSRSHGWFPESDQPGAAQRWWSGSRWTADRRPANPSFLGRPGALDRARGISAAVIALTLIVSQLTLSDVRAHADERGAVSRVIDGDTVDVEVGGIVKRVRFLNIDTPEVVDPNRPVECMGPEATSYTKSLLPAGTPVVLKFDGETVDGYGRTLAAVVRADGSNVSELLAGRGLGAPVDLGHRRFLREVQQANVRAQDARSGLFDDAKECTVPAAMSTLQNEAAALFVGQASLPRLSALDALASRAKTFAKRIDALDPTRSSIWRFYSAEQQRVMTASLAAIRYKSDTARSAPGERRAELAQQQKAKKAAARAKAAAAHRAAVKKAKALAKARVEASEEAARREAARRQEADSGNSGGGDLSGYTGCRKYAPGGKTWTPIPC